MDHCGYIWVIPIAQSKISIKVTENSVIYESNDLAIYDTHMIWFLSTSQVEEKFPTKPCLTKIIFSPVLLIVN